MSTKEIKFRMATAQTQFLFGILKQAIGERMKRCIRKSEITKKTLKVSMTIINIFTITSEIKQ